MSQHDFNIANQGFPATRADINNAFAALASTSSGASAPSTTFANQFWYDTANNLLMFRNEADSAWITLAYLDQATNEWEIRSAVIQAVDSAGVIIKTDEGTSRVTVADNGNVTIANNLAVSGNLSVTGTISGITQASLPAEGVNESKLQVSNAPVNGYALTAQSGNTGGLTWAEIAAGGGGKVLQVVSTINESQVSGSANVLIDAVSATITPTATTSKIIMMGQISTTYNGGAEYYRYRGTTQLGEVQNFRFASEFQTNQPIYWVDSPNSTSALTYKISYDGGGTHYVNASNGATILILMEIDNA